MKELGFSASVSQSGRCLLKNEQASWRLRRSLGAPPDAKDLSRERRCPRRPGRVPAWSVTRDHDAVREADDASAGEAHGSARRKGCGLARTGGQWEDICCCPTCGAGAERRPRSRRFFSWRLAGAGALCLQVARRRVAQVCRACCGARARVSGRHFRAGLGTCASRRWAVDGGSC